jgi:predicted short-subunit dehydrogenase-like oxidoreductase (DUF2520 family)
VNLPRLNVIGAGRAGRVVARWLFEADQVRIGQIANRSLDSARQAVDFIGAGRALERLEPLDHGDWLLVGLPDAALADLASVWNSGRPALAFHLSGSSTASLLEGVADRLASVHPVRAFADPERALTQMPGTFLTGEGDAQALEVLGRVIQAAGGRWQRIDGTDKRLYHAATVVASNYLVTLTDLARTLAAGAGLPEDAVRALLDELQQGTLSNLRSQSAKRALTGPIERGDAAQAETIQAAMERALPEQQRLLRELGRATLALAQRGRGSNPSDAAMERLFTSA